MKKWKWRAGEGLPERYPYSTDNSSYSFWDRKLFFCITLIHKSEVCKLLGFWFLIICQKISAVELSHFLANTLHIAYAIQVWQMDYNMDTVHTKKNPGLLLHWQLFSCYFSELVRINDLQRFGNFLRKNVCNYTCIYTFLEKFPRFLSRNTPVSSSGFNTMLKMWCLRRFCITASPDNNVEKLCDVFREYSKWRKDVNIPHYKSP